MIQAQDRFKLAPDVLFEDFDDEALLVDLQAEAIFSLNGTGTKIAELLKRGKTVGEIATVLAEEYEIHPSRLESELAGLIQTLLDSKLIVKSDHAE